jgi:hypothetical protein
MKLFDCEGTPNAARIRIVLAQKGLEEQVEFVSVDLIAAKTPREKAAIHMTQRRVEMMLLEPIGHAAGCPGGAPGRS